MKKNKNFKKPVWVPCNIVGHNFDHYHEAQKRGDLVESIANELKRQKFGDNWKDIEKLWKTYIFLPREIQTDSLKEQLRDFYNKLMEVDQIAEKMADDQLPKYSSPEVALVSFLTKNEGKTFLCKSEAGLLYVDFEDSELRYIAYLDITEII